MFWKRNREDEQKRLLEELGKIRQELSRIGDLLERLLTGGLIAQPPEVPQIEVAEAKPDGGTAFEAPAPPPEAVPHPPASIEMLTNRLRHLDLHIEQYLLVQGGTPMEQEKYHLSYFIGQNYAIVEPWLSQLRSTLSHPVTTRYPLNGASSEKISVLTNVGVRLYRLRMLYSYEYDRSASELLAKVDANPGSINYLSGGWFEMCVFQAVKKLLEARNFGSHLVLSDVKLAAAGGAHCQLDILIYSGVPNQRLVLLECKSAGSLEERDLVQVRRAVNLLKLNFRNAAVVMPLPPEGHLQNRWSERTGASVIGFTGIEDFLKEALR